MKVDESKSNKLKFGTKTSTWKDIGVDLCKKPGGGWGWLRGMTSDSKFHIDDRCTLSLKGMVCLERNLVSLIVYNMKWINLWCGKL